MASTQKIILTFLALNFMIGIAITASTGSIETAVENWETQYEKSRQTTIELADDSDNSLFITIENAVSSFINTIINIARFSIMIVKILFSSFLWAFVITPTNTIENIVYGTVLIFQMWMVLMGVLEVYLLVQNRKVGQ